jgi:hypothetical protein
VTELKRKLIERIREVGIDVPDGVVLRRLYPGHHQRAAGAWSWVAVDPETNAELVGSCHPMSELVAAVGIDVYHYDVFPTPELFPKDSA